MAAKHPHQSLIYVHGTNGSGKSTLARHLIMCAGGIRETKRHPKTQANVTYTHAGLTLLGKYTTPTGGADGVQPYSSVPKTALALLRNGKSVFIEGLMTPGVETCADLYDGAREINPNVEFRYIKLDIGFYQSQQNVLRRRQLTGNEKPLDPTNLRKKQASADAWFTRIAAAHLPIYGFINWKEARDFCLSAYQLNATGAVRLLDQ